MEKLEAILLFGFLVQTIINYISKIKDNGKISYKILLSIAFGLILAFGYDLDLIQVITGMEGKFFIGHVLTGIIFSGGSNLINDILGFTNKENAIE